MLVTRRMSLVEQALPTLPEHLVSPFPQPLLCVIVLSMIICCFVSFILVIVLPAYL
jgi:hypothetical protein